MSPSAWSFWESPPWAWESGSRGGPDTTAFFVAEVAKLRFFAAAKDPNSCDFRYVHLRLDNWIHVMTSKSAVNFRTTWMFLGAGAVLLAVLAAYVFFSDEKKPNPDGVLLESFHALKVKPNDVNGLEIEKGGEKIVFSRQPDGRWRMVQPIQARADSERIETIVHELLGAPRVEKGAGVTSDLAAHGLDHPAVKMTLQSGDRSAWLALGKTTLGGDEAVAYVLSSDAPAKPQAMRIKRLRSLLKEKPPENASTADLVLDVNDFRAHKLLGEGIPLEAAESMLKGVKITEKLAKGDRIVSLVREKGVWRFEIPPGYGDVIQDVPPNERKEKTIFNLKSLLADILAIEVFQNKDYLPDARDLAALGLDPSSPGVVRIDLDWGEPIGMETLWISSEYVKKEGDKVFARNAGEPTVAQVNAEKPRILRGFLENPAPLRDRTLVKLRSELVDAIDVTTDKNTFELRKIDGKWKVGGGGSTLDADPAIINELLFRLSEPRQILGFPPENANDDELGLAPPKVDIKIWEGGFIAPATDAAWPKTTETPTARIQFGKSDSDFVFVRRYSGLTKLDAKMSSRLLELASRGRYDYIDIALTSFDPVNVEKISFVKDGENWEIERDEGGGINLPAGWKILKPDNQKGNPVNGEQMVIILESFKALKPEKVVYAKPSAEELMTLGLDPANPVFKLSLKLKDPGGGRSRDGSSVTHLTVEHVYYFGNPVTGKPSVYTKTSFCDFVFESPVSRVELVTKGRLLDPILYRLELANVKGLKLRGWVDPAKPGEPMVFELERKAGGNWSARGDLKLNNAKVEQFMTDILQPRSLGQAADKTGPKPEHGLDLNQGALEIEIDVRDAKPVTLTLGGPVSKDSKQIFATTNRSPGEVFTIDGDRLLPVKEKREALLEIPPAGDKK
jgi:Domain of unknown function (DUF4340)